MICVSIARGSYQHVITEHRRMADQGAKLVELRLDYIRGPVELKKILKDRPTEVIVTCRREADGGKWSETEEARQALLRAAIAEQVEYIDLEEDIAETIPRFGKTKRIVSMHDFNGTPEDLTELHAWLASKDPDIIKIAAMAHNPHDNLRMLRLSASSSIPTVAICMGEIGIPSRLLAGRYGAPFTYATFHSDRTLAPGQLSFRDMADLYAYNRIDRDTEIFGVIADPIGHSLSPLVHNTAFQELGMNRIYLPFRIPREHLDQFLDDCRELDIRGLSVTIPHKEAVIRRCTKIDGAVRGVGAVNTILFHEGETLGLNTDYRAAMESLDATMHLTDKDDLKDRTALVLGAGGVAKAVVFGLKRRGADVVVSGIIEEQARRLAARQECRTVPWEKRHDVKPDIVINGTPVGMHPNVDEVPFDVDALRPGSVVFDMVYNPEQTLLIKNARKRGCLTITGVQMFLRQAALQFKHFTDQEAPIELMHHVMKSTLGAVKM